MNYAKMFSLAGKSAIVTGGAGILGRRCCEALAQAGANVAIVDIDGAGARKLSQKLRDDYPVKTAAILCDVSKPAQVSRMVKAAVRALGPIHILHNNAASKSKELERFFETFENYSLSEWRNIMSVNIDGMFLVAQAVGRQMIQQRSGGSVVQTASIYGLLAPDPRIYEGSHYLKRAINTPAVYTASKASVIGLTRHLAVLWAEHGIRVNTLTPGGVESGQNDIFKRNYSKRIPMGRMAKPHEMAGALIYLASEASSYVTGQNLVVDGGLSAW